MGRARPTGASRFDTADHNPETDQTPFATAQGQWLAASVFPASDRVAALPGIAAFWQGHSSALRP